MLHYPAGTRGSGRGQEKYSKHSSFRFYLGTKCGYKEINMNSTFTMAVFSSRPRQCPLFKVRLFTPKGWMGEWELEIALGQKPKRFHSVPWESDRGHRELRTQGSWPGRRASGDPGGRDCGFQKQR